MNEATLINKINTTFPDANAVSMKEWDGREEAGIWFQGSDTCVVDGIPLFDYYNKNGEQAHPKLKALLEEANWYFEYLISSDTLMVFPIPN